MADTDDKIKYSDLVSPDDSIKQLIEQLGTLNASYNQLLVAVKAGAKEIVKAMKDMSTATSEGREHIDDATEAANRLKRAEKELKFAMSETGQQVAWLKSQTASHNKMSAEQAKQAKALVGSYDKLKLELREHIQLWKSLSETERRDPAFGGQILEKIMILRSDVSSLDSQLKLHVEQLSAVQKAEQKLAFLQSEEGQRLIELKRQISEVITGRKRGRAAIDEVVAAEERLAQAKSRTNAQVQELNLKTREANRIAKLTAQLNNSAEGSYNRLAAQYSLNKIKLDAMSKEERKAAEVGKKLEQETRAIYKEMVHLQEATGNHRLSLGNYTKAWNGLGMATNQVIRELPAAAVGINTFFLGISNNIPILVDEINKVKAANKEAIAQGKPTVSVMKQITGAIFNWQTGLVILLTYLSMHGKEVIAWAKKLYRGADATMTMTERLDAMQEELKNTNGSYGSNIVTLRQLQHEWQNLSSKKEQIQWIRDNKSEFDKLGISIDSTIEAENAFVDNTEAVIEALKLRARATAAQKLAADKYEKALIKRNEAETEAIEGPGWQDALVAAGVKAAPIAITAANIKAGMFISAKRSASMISTSLDDFGAIEQAALNKRVADLNAEATAAEKDADAFFDLARAYEDEAKAALKAAGIREKTKGPKKTPKGRTPTDLTDVINKNQINLRRKYEMSITALQHDEYAKRRKEAVDATMTEIDQLREKYRKNETYVANINGKYKTLTEDQKIQIAQQQKWILDTITSTQEKLKFELEQIEKERQINSLKITRETIDWQLEEIVRSVEEEKRLRLQQLAQEEELVKNTNVALEEGARTEAEITAEYQKRRAQVIAEYDLQILKMREADVAAQLDVVKKGAKEELDLLLWQNEIARQIALSENRAKPAAQQRSESSINEVFDQKARTITGTFAMTGFDEAQAQAEAVFNITKHNETEITKFKLTQEKNRWEEQIRLAKSGALKWSDTQLATAEATVKGLERQINEVDNFINLIGDKGVGGALLTKLGFDDDQISALEKATSVVLEQLQAIAKAEVDLAQQAVDKAKERVNAAESAYEAEIEARNNGYANNVATAKKELQQEKKNQQEKEKILAAAQKRQEAIQTAVQSASLITASAELWSSFAGIPIVGPALALAAIAAMWTSFAVAKVKAAQVTKAASQEYGEGGLEFLEGGSHASGNDIDLATKNSKGKNMRAEGGEAMAIINKRSTRHYRRQLPGIIDSLNKGTFEDKYLRAFESGETLQAQISQSPVLIDLSRLERDVTEIKKQNATRYYQMGDTTLIVKGNVKRYIRQ